MKLIFTEPTEREYLWSTIKYLNKEEYDYFTIVNQPRII